MANFVLDDDLSDIEIDGIEQVSEPEEDGDDEFMDLNGDQVGVNNTAAAGTAQVGNAHQAAAAQEQEFDPLDHGGGMMQGMQQQEDMQQSQQRMSRMDTVEAGAPESSSILEQALENVSSEGDNLDDGHHMQRTPAIDAPHHFQGVDFEFDDEDAFFNDIPPIISDRQQQAIDVDTEPQLRQQQIVVESPQLATSISAFENQEQQLMQGQQETMKKEKLQLTKADLRRKDVPLFDCIFCVENKSSVMKGMLKKSLVNKYLEVCREIAGNEQIPISFGLKDEMTKYDPDRVQDYLTGSVKDDNATAPLHLKMLEKTIKKEFLTSSLWLKQQQMLPSKREKVMEHRDGKIPASFKTKVTIPLVKSKSESQKNILRRSQHLVFLRRAMYSQQFSFKTSAADVNEQRTQQVDAEQAKAATQATQANELRLDELEEEEFEGKVTVDNWAMSRAQKIIRNISFESATYDIYRPEFSSDASNTSSKCDRSREEDEQLFASEEAKGRICDERLSEMNPCGEGDYFESSGSSTSLPSIKPALLSQALSIGRDRSQSNEFSAQSNKTEIERCPVPQNQDSENLQEDDIRESLAVKQLLQMQKTLEHKTKSLLVHNNNPNDTDVNVEVNADGDNAMETPQLSDISSFNPDDPHVRQIDDIDTSSLESDKECGEVRPVAGAQEGDENGDKNRKQNQERKETPKDERRSAKKQSKTDILGRNAASSLDKDKVDEDDEVSSEMSVAEEVTDQQVHSRSQLFNVPETNSLHQNLTATNQSFAKVTKQQTDSSIMLLQEPVSTIFNRTSSIISRGGAGAEDYQTTMFQAAEEPNTQKFSIKDQASGTSIKPVNEFLHLRPGANPLIAAGSHQENSSNQTFGVKDQKTLAGSPNISSSKPTKTLAAPLLYNTGVAPTRQNSIFPLLFSSQVVFKGKHTMSKKALPEHKNNIKSNLAIVTAARNDRTSALHQSTLSAAQSKKVASKNHINRSVIVSQSSSTESQMFKNPFQTNRSNQQQRSMNTSLRWAKAKTEEKTTKIGAFFTVNTTKVQSIAANLDQTPQEEPKHEPKILPSSSEQPQAASLLQHLILMNQDSRSRSTFGPKSSLQKSSFKGMPSGGRGTAAGSTPSVVKDPQIISQFQTTPVSQQLGQPKSRIQSLFRRQTQTFKHNTVPMLETNLSKAHQQDNVVRINAPADNDRGQTGHEHQRAAQQDNAVKAGNTDRISKSQKRPPAQLQGQSPRSLIQMIHPTPLLKKVIQPTGNITAAVSQETLVASRNTSKVTMITESQTTTHKQLVKGSRNASRSPFDFNQRNSMRMQKSPSLTQRGANTTSNAYQKSTVKSQSKSPQHLVLNARPRHTPICTETSNMHNLVHRQQSSNLFNTTTGGPPCTLLQQKTALKQSSRQNASRSGLVIVTSSYRSRELSEDDFKAQSAYQNKILFKQQAEKLNSKSFLQNVHENSRKVKNAMLDDQKTPYDFYGKQQSLDRLDQAASTDNLNQESLSMFEQQQKVELGKPTPPTNTRLQLHLVASHLVQSLEVPESQQVNRQLEKKDSLLSSEQALALDEHHTDQHNYPRIHCEKQAQQRLQQQQQQQMFSQHNHRAAQPLSHHMLFHTADNFAAHQQRSPVQRNETSDLSLISKALSARDPCFSSQTSSMQKLRSQSSKNNHRLNNQFQYLTPKLLVHAKAAPASTADKLEHQRQEQLGATVSVNKLFDGRLSPPVTAQRPTVSNFQGTTMLQKRQHQQNIQALPQLQSPSTKTASNINWSSNSQQSLQTSNKPQSKQKPTSVRTNNIFAQQQSQLKSANGSQASREPHSKILAKNKESLAQNFMMQAAAQSKQQLMQHSSRENASSGSLSFVKLMKKSQQTAKTNKN